MNIFRWINFNALRAVKSFRCKLFTESDFNQNKHQNNFGESKIFRWICENCMFILYLRNIGISCYKNLHMYIATHTYPHTHTHPHLPTHTHLPAHLPIHTPYTPQTYTKYTQTTIDTPTYYTHVDYVCELSQLVNRVY